MMRRRPAMERAPRIFQYMVTIWLMRRRATDVRTRVTEMKKSPSILRMWKRRSAMAVRGVGCQLKMAERFQGKNRATMRPMTAMVLTARERLNRARLRPGVFYEQAAGDFGFGFGGVEGCAEFAGDDEEHGDEEQEEAHPAEGADEGPDGGGGDGGEGEGGGAVGLHQLPGEGDDGGGEGEFVGDHGDHFALGADGGVGGAGGEAAGDHGEGGDDEEVHDEDEVAIAAEDGEEAQGGDGDVEEQGDGAGEGEEGGAVE